MPSEPAGNRSEQAVPRTSLGISNYSALRGLSRARDNPLDGDAELARFVDEIVGDARAWESDEALGQEVEQLVVAAEGCCPTIGCPVRLADDLVHGVPLGPSCGNLLDAGAAAMDEDDVVILDLELVEGSDDGGGVVGLLAACDPRPVFPRAGAP